MREPPEELTAGLLSLVLEEEVSQVMGISGIVLRFSYKYLGYAEVNIDTLTRLMRAFRYKNGLVATEEWVDQNGNFDIAYRLEDGKMLQQFNITPEQYFARETQATHWVAKEKGLI